MPILRNNYVAQGFIPARSRLQIININVTTFDQDLTEDERNSQPATRNPTPETKHKIQNTKPKTMNDLFEYSARQALQINQPLAERMRPTHIKNYMGQLDAMGEGRLVRQAIEQDKLFSMILWGPPGCGKTTLAKLMASETSAHFMHFSAVLSGVKEIRSVIKIAEERRNLYRQHTVLFVDEIHRFNKAQQDAFLHHVARRMVRFAAEDIGMADPHALNMALNGMEAYRFLGSPEGELALAQCAVYLATAPKSNSIYKAYAKVSKTIARTGSLATPLHTRNAPTKLMADVGYGKGYRYAHDYKDAITAQEYLPDMIRDHRFYDPSDRGFEQTVKKRLAYWRHVKGGQAEPAGPPKKP